MTAALETHGLGKRYGSTWALSDCTLTVPEGAVTALVGPNGAGKTTLLHLAVGLTKPTTGSVVTRGNVGFVAQDHPLYGRLTIAEMLHVGRALNESWDEETARARIGRLGLPLKKKVSKLSGGQRAQVALTLALAKLPDVLLLDEPVASLDPLARREFMQSVLEDAAERGMTVVLSSHIVADLERMCDHLIILSRSRTQLAGSIETALAEHRLLVGPRSPAPDGVEVIREKTTERQSTLLVRSERHVYDARWQVLEVDLEEIVLAYLGQGVEHSLAELEAVGA